ncbi:MAG: hypothetical protein ACI9XU_000647 [Arenicella sp.]|jgi:hypothetical protein
MKEKNSSILGLLLSSDAEYTPLEFEIIADLDVQITAADFTLTLVASNGRLLTYVRPLIGSAVGQFAEFCTATITSDKLEGSVSEAAIYYVATQM